jgi:hypothetical protein
VALTPGPSPITEDGGERGDQADLPFSRREKGPGDEGYLN